MIPLLRLLLLKLHKKPRYTSARDSVSTPLGLKAYRDVNTLKPAPRCPKCGLYVSPRMHPNAECERVRALYPMLRQRYVDLDASLDEGVERARNRCYVPEVDE